MFGDYDWYDFKMIQNYKKMDNEKENMKINAGKNAMILYIVNNIFGVIIITKYYEKMYVY